MQKAMRRCGAIHVALALLAAGDSQAGRAAAVAARAPVVAWVQIDGCMVDTWFTAAEGRIDAVNTRGQLVASAQADSQGVFHLRVPARAAVRIRPASATHEGMPLEVRESNFKMSTCLIDFGPP